MKNFKILKIILLLLSCCTFFSVVNSITVGGLYSTPGKWKFITKFCFQDQGGHVIMKLFHSLSKDTKILLYSDKNPNYNELLDDIYGNKYSCEQKVSFLIGILKILIHQYINIFNFLKRFLGITMNFHHLLIIQMIWIGRVECKLKV